MRELNLGEGLRVMAGDDTGTNRPFSGTHNQGAAPAVAAEPGDDYIPDQATGRERGSDRYVNPSPRASDANRGHTPMDGEPPQRRGACGRT